MHSTASVSEVKTISKPLPYTHTHIYMHSINTGIHKNNLVAARCTLILARLIYISLFYEKKKRVDSPDVKDIANHLTDFISGNQFHLLFHHQR